MFHRESVRALCALFAVEKASACFFGYWTFNQCVFFTSGNPVSFYDMLCHALFN